MPSKEEYPGWSSETHPEKFNIQAMPEQPKVLKLGQLPEERIKEFFEKGYMVIEDFFTKEEIDPCKPSINQMVEDLAQKLYKAGKIKNLYSEYGFYERLTHLEKEFPGTNILLHKVGIMGKAIQDIWANEKMLNLLEQILGPDIVGHPVWNLRVKTPKNEATVVPWHQDAGYMDNRSYDVLQITAWIPLINATEFNGCMQVAEFGHKKGKVASHQCCHGGTWYVMLEEEEMQKSLDVDLNKDIKTVPIPYGGVLLFSNLLPHRSLPNFSQDIRWSLDLRWQKASEEVGFYDIKGGLLMRSSKDPDLKIDWDAFNAVDRVKKGIEATVEENDKEKLLDDFDTTIQGPWMKKWEITHVNRHVQAHRTADGEDPSKWTKA